jgi:hypothetical protein
MLYGAYALALACVIVVFVAMELASRRGFAPVAQIVSHARRRRARLALWVVGGIACAWLAWWLGDHATQVVYFRDGAGGPSADRRIYLGTADHFHPQDPSRRCPHEDPIWIVNESSRTLSVHSISYSGFRPSEVETLPPQGVSCESSLDQVGPDHPPPDTHAIEAMPLGARFLLISQVWVTWDR